MFFAVQSYRNLFTMNLIFNHPSPHFFRRATEMDSCIDSLTSHILSSFPIANIERIQNGKKSNLPSWLGKPTLDWNGLQLTKLAIDGAIIAHVFACLAVSSGLSFWDDYIFRHGSQGGHEPPENHGCRSSTQ